MSRCATFRIARQADKAFLLRQNLSAQGRRCTAKIAYIMLCMQDNSWLPSSGGLSVRKTTLRRGGVAPPALIEATANFDGRAARGRPYGEIPTARYLSFRLACFAGDPPPSSEGGKGGSAGLKSMKHA